MGKYYVDTINGSDTTGTGVQGNPYKTVSKVLGLSLVGENELLLFPGEYRTSANYINLNNAKHSNLTIVGCDNTGAPSESAIDLVHIFGTPGVNKALSGSGVVQNVTVKYVSLYSAGTFVPARQESGAGGWRWLKVRFSHGEVTDAATLLQIYGDPDFELDACIFDCLIPSGPSSAFAAFTGNTSGRINNCIAGLSGRPATYGFMFPSGHNGTILINNTIVAGGWYAIQIASATSTIVVNNSILSGGVTSLGTTTIARTAGSVTVNKSLIFGSPYKPATSPYISGAVTLDAFTAASLGENPRFTAYAKPGYVTIAISEIGESLSYAEELEAMLSARGFKATLYIHGKLWDTANNEALRQMVARGVVEIGGHTQDHQPPAATTAGTVTYSGAGANPQYRIDLVNHQFAVKTDTADSYTVNLPDDNYLSIGVAISEIRANTSNSWNFTYDVFSGVPTTASLKLSSCVGVDWTAISTKVALDRTDTDLSDGGTGYFADEILRFKNNVESWVNGDGDVIDPQTGSVFRCNSYSTPAGQYDANYNTAIRTAGFTSSRCIPNFAQLITNFDLFSIYTLDANSLVRTTAADTKKLVRNVAYGMLQAGGAITLFEDQQLLSTTADNCWPAILDALAEFVDVGLRITSQQLLADDLRSPPYNYNPATGITTRPVITEPDDCHLQPSSSCLGTGSKIPGVTADIEGNPLFPPYNIGPYGLAEGALGVAPVTNEGAPRNNIARLTGTSTTIDPAGNYQFSDTNAWRVVTGWAAGTANDFFDENGVPIPFTGQQAIDAGIGPRFYCGLKGVAGYTVDQDAAANAKIIRILKVPTYIDTLYWSDSAEMDWSASNE